MKKISVLALLTLSVFGPFTLSYADSDYTATAPACTLSADEKAFAAQLSDVNQTIFCGMTSEERAKCMKMAGTVDAEGNQITPDRAVSDVLGTGGCPSN